MKGFTNSLSFDASSSGDGDVVFAINNTGAPIVAGQKVWLNKHNLGDEEITPYTSGLYSQQVGTIGIWGTANDEVYATNGGGRTLFKFNSKDKTWSRSGLNEAKSATSVVYNKETHKYYCNYINVISGFSNATGNFCSFETNKNTFGDTSFYGYIINDDLELVYSATGIYKIQTRTDKSLVKELDLNDFGRTIFSVLYDNGILMITTEYLGVAYFLRYSLLKSDYFAYSCELLSCEKTNVLISNSKIISYATGLNVGDYLFAKYATEQLINNPFTRLFIYKITEKGLVVADDIPSELSCVSHEGCSAWFDNRTNRLYVGLSDDLLLFKYDNGKFTSVDLNINILDYITPKDKAFTFSVSDDLTTICVSYSSSQSNSARVSLLRFNAPTNDWFADKYSLIADTSLIGFATGKTDEQGRYEVVTILPEVYNLTLNISPDITDDEIVFKGEANVY